MNHESIHTKTYFEEVGAWPRHSSRLLPAYVTGFVLSVLLTVAAYVTASLNILNHQMLFILLALYALAQFGVQLVCFLHLGREAAARERIIVLGFALLIVFILVGGSLWIMFSLNDRMMPSVAQMEQFVQSQSGL